MLEILIPNGFADTPKILVEHLEGLSVPVQSHWTFKSDKHLKPSKARVCWGISGYGDIPELNAKVGRMDKLGELKTFHKAGISAPKWWDGPPTDEDVYPILARNSSHYLGKDIRTCENSAKARAVSAAYYTQLILNDVEYRVWIFRDRCLGVYRVVNKALRMGADYPMYPPEIGWSYERLYEEEGDTIPETAIRLAKEAIAAMKYDFGAVDILHGTDRRYYVLETNSAPGAETNRQYALILLARQIKKWYEEL
jgi:hypothetical protein